MPDLEKFKKLNDEKKFRFVLEMVKRKKIVDYKSLNNALSLLGVDQRWFINTFQTLLEKRKLSSTDLDWLDDSPYKVKGPGFFTHRMIKRWDLEKEFCMTLPPKDYGKFPMCRQFASLASLEVGESTVLKAKPKDYTVFSLLIQAWLDIHVHTTPLGPPSPPPTNRPV